MRKILSAIQIKEGDAFTIEHEPISSIALMERAAKTFVKFFSKRYRKNNPVKIFCGPGNNGGDGLVAARLLQKKDYEVSVYILDNGSNFSDEFLQSEERLFHSGKVPVYRLNEAGKFPEIHSDDIVIDALWGTGLSRNIKGLGAELIHHINKYKTVTVSIDIPSGLYTDKQGGETFIHSDYIISFQFPKLSFLFPENQTAVNEWEVADIGISDEFIETVQTSHFYIEEKDIRKIIRPRGKFDHKGKFGHALIVTGSAGKIGASLLCAKACLKSGAGLTTAHVPRIANQILQSSIPDVMLSLDEHENIITKIGNTDAYTTIGIGPGIGTETLTQQAVLNLLNKFRKPMVLDADALNILSVNKKWFSYVPEQSILTPHPKEFERLFGKTKNSFERLELQKKKSVEHKIIIVLKGAHTCITTPEGNAFFNSTGNPGMAKGGSGDVLTGMITSFLAQGYSSEESAIAGAYLHGLAADIAVKNETEFNLTASEIVENISEAFRNIINISQH